MITHGINKLFFIVLLLAAPPKRFVYFVCFWCCLLSAAGFGIKYAANGYILFRLRGLQENYTALVVVPSPQIVKVNCAKESCSV